MEPLALDRTYDRVSLASRPFAAPQAVPASGSRRALRVDIDLSPRNPQPTSTIEVRAVAWDPTKRLDPNQEQITLEVKRDLTAVPVAWRQAGSTWTASIPPTPTAGPTVIRVVARDAFGAEIGRGFVEIADAVQETR